jgi:hypothetical protein
VVAVVAVVVAVPLVAGGIFLWSFSGGWDGIRPKAQPTDGTVVSAREASADRTRSDHEAAVRQVIATTGGTSIAATEVDTCREGMNDWKNHDGYTLSCSRTAATAIQLPPTAAFDVVVQEVDDAVTEQGWRPTESIPRTNDGFEAVRRYRGDAPDASLSIGVSTRDVTPIYLPDPVFADWSDGRGDSADVETAFESGTGVRLLVVSEITYFED